MHVIYNYVHGGKCYGDNTYTVKDYKRKFNPEEVRHACTNHYKCIDVM